MSETTNARDDRNRRHHAWVEKTAAKGWPAEDDRSREAFGRREACISKALDAGWHPDNPATRHLAPWLSVVTREPVREHLARAGYELSASLLGITDAALAWFHAGSPGALGGGEFSSELLALHGAAVMWRDASEAMIASHRATAAAPGRMAYAVVLGESAGWKQLRDRILYTDGGDAMVYDTQSAAMAALGELSSRAVVVPLTVGQPIGGEDAVTVASNVVVDKALAWHRAGCPCLRDHKGNSVESLWGLKEAVEEHKSAAEALVVETRAKG